MFDPPLIDSFSIPEAQHKKTNLSLGKRSLRIRLKKNNQVNHRGTEHTPSSHAKRVGTVARRAET
jgi:hypothetical protein